MKHKSKQQAISHAMTAPMAVSIGSLLYIYLIIPICLIVQLLDTYFFGHHLQSILPTSPESYFLLSLLFGTPHIIASNVILTTNNDYFKRYRNSIIGMTVFIIAFFAIGNFVLSFNMLFAIVATITIIHVVKQQIGIGNSAYRLSGALFYAWSWCAIIIGVIIYNLIYLKHTFSYAQFYYGTMALIGLSFMLVLLTCICHRRVNTRLGQTFLWSNTLMVVVSFYLFSQDYYFLAILIPRLIHDFTAFAFYIVHDYNRHHEHPQNWLYRMAAQIRLNSFILVPLVAILLTFILQQYGDSYFSKVTAFLFGASVPGAISLGFIGYLGLMHYFTEAFTWKNGSPYRAYIRFKI